VNGEEAGILDGSIEPARDRYTGFIDRHLIAWELMFAMLAIAYVIVGFAEETWLTVPLEVALTVVFFGEFLSRIAASRDRRAYLRDHWIDLLALVPTTRALRLLRLARLLRLVRAFAGVYRALNHLSALARHRGLALLLSSWAAVMVICSLALYAAENGVNEAITSPLDALWWGIVTLTTVGYGDVVPKTGEGRLAASVLMLLGIGLFSAITAVLTSYLLGGRSERTSADRMRDLQQLRAEGLLTEDEYVATRKGVLADL
jgi:voltage-gated potassium channel